MTRSPVDRCAGGDLRVLEIRDLHVDFHTEDGVVQAVRGVSFAVPRGTTVALLGESGCGKSVTGLSILRLIDPPGRIRGGEILFRKRTGFAAEMTVDLAGLDPEGPQMRAIRGHDIAMIFQEPRQSLTPVYTIGEQIIETICVHEGVGRREARRRAVEMLARVGMPAPERRIDEYPHQLSGGMCQRAMIAMALCCSPALLIADEPTTSLDVTIQAQVLELLAAQEKLGMTTLLITHDMGVVAEIADEVVVMYLGQVMEVGPVEAIFDGPAHPYTQGLFACVPSPTAAPGQPLPRIPGAVPDPRHAPVGCPFRGRCAHEMPECAAAPPLVPVEPDTPRHRVACWLHAPATAEVGGR